MKSRGIYLLILTILIAYEKVLLFYRSNSVCLEEFSLSPILYSSLVGDPEYVSHLPSQSGVRNIHVFYFIYNFLFYLSCDLILLHLHFIISFAFFFFFFFRGFQLGSDLNGGMLTFS